MGKELSGVITLVEPRLDIRGKLYASCDVKLDNDVKLTHVALDQRQLDAIIPVDILLGKGKTASKAFLNTIEPILIRMAEGRRVKVEEGLNSCSFFGWKEVSWISFKS